MGDRSRNLRSLERAVGTKKWYIRLFFGLLGFSIHNAYVIFSQMHPEVTKAKFLMLLQEQLIHLHLGVIPKPKLHAGVSTPTTPPSMTRTEEIRRNTAVSPIIAPDFTPASAQHQLVPNNMSRSKKRAGKRKLRECVVHKEQGVRKQTAFHCDQCTVALCRAPEVCFTTYDHNTNPNGQKRRNSPTKTPASGKKKRDIRGR